MENEQYEKNFEQIQNYMEIVNTKSDYFTSDQKDKFAKSIREDEELMVILLSKSKMPISVQERFISYLADLVQDFLD